MSMRPRITRRGLLRATSLAAGAAALAPFVPILESDAEDGGFPVRLVLFYMPVGTYLPSWRPTGTTTDFTLSPVLAPLAAHQSSLTVLDGIDNAAVREGPGKSGHPGINCLFTGMPHTVGDFESGGASGFGWPAGPSIDQFLADRIAETSPLPFRSLEVGVESSQDPKVWRTRMCFRGPDEPVPADDDPASVFDKLFADSQIDPQELAKLRAAQLSVIDTVKGDLQRLQTKIATADVARMQSHLDNLAGIEARLQGEAQQCSELPPAPGGGLANPAAVDAQIDMVVGALECGLTQVASLMIGKETGGLGQHQWLGHSAGHHEISHGTDATSRTQLRDINVWYAEKFARLLDRMAAIPEGDGTMLDNSIVVWASPIGQTWTHSMRNVPVVVAGRGGGALSPGQWLKFGAYGDTQSNNDDHGGRAMNDLLLTLCHAMGHPVDTFGLPSLCTGPITEMMT